jgi:hypothetical protein
VSQKRKEASVADANQVPKDLIGFLDYYLIRKVPFQIPDAGREWIVRFGPWLTLVFLALFLPVVLVALGLDTMLTPLAGQADVTGFGYAAFLIVATFALMMLALPGLFARRKSGWTLLFYSELLHIVTSLVSRSIIGGLIGGLIGLYILFQIRTLYHP